MMASRSSIVPPSNTPFTYAADRIFASACAHDQCFYIFGCLACRVLLRFTTSRFFYIVAFTSGQFSAAACHCTDGEGYHYFSDDEFSFGFGPGFKCDGIDAELNTDAGEYVQDDFMLMVGLGRHKNNDTDSNFKPSSGSFALDLATTFTTFAADKPRGATSESVGSSAGKESKGAPKGSAPSPEYNKVRGSKRTAFKILKVGIGELQVLP